MPTPPHAWALAVQDAHRRGIYPSAASLLTGSLAEALTRHRLLALLGPAGLRALDEAAETLVATPLSIRPPGHELRALAMLSDSVMPGAPLGLRSLWALMAEPTAPPPEAPPTSADLQAADELYRGLAAVVDSTDPDELAGMSDIRILDWIGTDPPPQPQLLGADWSTVRALLLQHQVHRASLLE